MKPGQKLLAIVSFDCFSPPQLFREAFDMRPDPNITQWDHPWVRARDKHLLEQSSIRELLAVAAVG